MFATGETVGLAEWIIDDTYLVSFYFRKLCVHIHQHKAAEEMGNKVLLAGA